MLHECHNRSTLSPTEKVWSCAPQTLAASVCASCRDATAATKEESKPPDRSTPKGTSVISRFMTACKNMKRTMSRQPKSSQKQHNIGSLLNSAAKQSKAKISSKGWTFFLQNLRFKNYFPIDKCVCVCVFLVGFLHESDPWIQQLMRERTQDLLESSAEYCWIIWSWRDQSLWIPSWVEISAKSSCTAAAVDPTSIPSDRESDATTKTEISQAKLLKIVVKKNCKLSSELHKLVWLQC